MRKFLLNRLILTASLTSLLLSAGCAKSNVCPPFPVPSAHVASRLDALAAQDAEVARWGNDLLRLQEKLEVCR